MTQLSPVTNCKECSLPIAINNRLNMDEDECFVSVITSTYNCSKKIIETSVSMTEIKKKYRNKIQWIVVDGGSDDDTLGFIEANKSLISELIIEQDSGIYDAWNKGLKRVRGTWVIFLGAGDRLPVKWIETLLISDSKYELIYADLKILNSKKDFIKKNTPWKIARKEIKKSMCLLHPGMAHNKKIFLCNDSFNQNFKIISDWIFLREANIFKAKYCSGEIQAEFRMDGISSTFTGQKKTYLEKKIYLKGINKKVPLRESVKYTCMCIFGEFIYSKLLIIIKYFLASSFINK